MHTVSRLIVTDGSFNRRVIAGLGEETPVHLVDEGQPTALQRVRFLRADIVQRLVTIGIEKRALMGRRQETVAEDVEAAQGYAAASEHDETRKVVVSPFPDRS